MEAALALLIPILFVISAAVITITAMSQHHRRRLEEIRAKARSHEVQSEGIREELAELKDRMNILIMSMEGRRPAPALEADRLEGRPASFPPPVPQDAMKHQAAGTPEL